MTTFSYPTPPNPPTPPVDPGVAAHAQATTTQASTLPFTGGDVLGLTGIGLSAVLLGTALLRRSRRVRVA